MSDVASAVELPDVESLQAPPPPELPDVETLKSAPMLQNPRGPRGGIPDSVAARFGSGDAFTRIFSAAASRLKDGYANTFAALTGQDQQDMIDAGYKPGDFKSVGGALRFGADVFRTGLATIEDGFLSVGPALTEGVAGLGEQLSRETGIGEPTAIGREFGGIAEATLADVGDMHALSMVDAAKAQAAVPGVYSQAFRVDQTPGGGLVHTPLGRLPTELEAVGQAQVAAQVLHLPESTADLIHKTYVDTGHPPAEVLMDAKTNNGGVLDDLVAGKTPTTYQGPPRAMTPEELAAAKPGVNPEEGASTVAPTPEPESGISKIGQSINQKAVEAKLTEGFANTAGYDKITIADQAERATNLVNDNFDQARAVIRGEKPLPEGLKGVALVTAMEDYIKANPNADLAYELANSPLVSATSSAAQELRLAAERTPDSATAKIQELRDAQVKQAGGPKQVAQRRIAVKQAMPEANGVFLPKEQLSIDRFLDEIKC